VALPVTVEVCRRGHWKAAVRKDTEATTQDAGLNRGYLYSWVEQKKFPQKKISAVLVAAKAAGLKFFPEYFQQTSHTASCAFV